MAKFSLFLGFGAVLCVTVGWAAGLAPRPSRAEYSVTCFTENLAVGATLVNPDQVRRLFGADVDHQYIVVEVGFYSKTRAAFDVRHADFSLRNHVSRTLVRPANQSEMTAGLAAKLLPEVSTSQAVAGYLFFPVTEQKRLLLRARLQGLRRLADSAAQTVVFPPRGKMKASEFRRTGPAHHRNSQTTWTAGVPCRWLRPRSAPQADA